MIPADTTVAELRAALAIGVDEHALVADLIADMRRRRATQKPVANGFATIDALRAHIEALREEAADAASDLTVARRPLSEPDPDLRPHEIAAREIAWQAGVRRAEARVTAVGEQIRVYAALAEKAGVSVNEPAAAGSAPKRTTRKAAA